MGTSEPRYRRGQQRGAKKFLEPRRCPGWSSRGCPLPWRDARRGRWAGFCRDAAKGTGFAGQRSSTAKPPRLSYPSQRPQPLPVSIFPPPQPHRLQNKCLNLFSELSSRGGQGEPPAGTQGCHEEMLCLCGHRVPGHSSTGTVCALGPPRTNTPRRGWSHHRDQGRASARRWAQPRAASEGAAQGEMPASARVCSCSCPWLLERDPAARGCPGWGVGRPGTGAFSDAPHSGESLCPWQRGSGQP